MLVVGVSTRRGFVVALLLPTAIAFVGFLVFLVWVLAVSVALALRRPAAV